jgi:hypothetical protein
MEDKRVYPRITITLEPSVIAKLPKRDRSAFINLIIKQHFQKEGFDQMYELLKKRLLADKDINDWMVATAREVR